MKNERKLVFMVAFLFIAILFLGTKSNAASDFTLKQMDFGITLNEDGSMRVTETWNIKVHGTTNTLFKTFKVDSTKYKSLQDVSVAEITSTGTKAFTQISTEMYHVTTDCFYALKNSSGEFEIAWGVNKDSGSRTYKISYTLEDAIKNYADCAELYWQFIGNSFSTDIDKVTGTITLPVGATKEDIRAWAHGPLNGNISIDSGTQVSFEVEYLDAGSMVEVRLALPTSLFSQNTNISSAERLSTILSEEQTWADEANRTREYYRAKLEQEQERKKAIQNVMLALSVVVGVVLAFQIKKAHERLKENKKTEPSIKLDYYRDFPREDATPAEAAYLYYFKNGGINYQMSKILSSTMLDLCLKKYIEFEVQPKSFGKDEIIVKMLEGRNAETLKENEKTIYELLDKIKKTETNSFTMKDLEKYAKNHYGTFLNKLEKISNQVQKEEENLKNYDKEIKNKGNKWAGIGTAYIVGTVISLGAMLILGVFTWAVPVLVTLPLFILSLCYYKLAGRFDGLTQKGVDEKEQWKGLKKYMEDFSMMDEKSVPELVLWEKYLVFATAFGIADKVLKQLKVKYPEFSNEEYMNTTTYLYLMNRGNFSTSFVNSLNTSVNRAYNSGVSARATANGYSYGNSSSGGGFGGGFSGGGGFGRRWRPAAVADKENKRKKEENKEKNRKLKIKISKKGK